MILNRLSEVGIEDWDQSWIKPNNRLPNCTAYCMLEFYENGGAKTPLFRGRGVNSWGNAKTWYDTYLYDKGQEPKPNSWLVFGGNEYGHVVYCYDVEKNGDKFTCKCSESNYNNKIFNLRTIVVPSENYLGCCYLDLIDKRVARNTKANQLIVTYDKIKARNDNLEEYKGRYVPVGIYNVEATKTANNYTWCKLDNDVWCAVIKGSNEYCPVEDKTSELKKKIVELENQNEKLKEKLRKINEESNI